MIFVSNEIDRTTGMNVQITNTVTAPEIAFTGDTMSDFIVDPNNADVLKARVLVMEVMYMCIIYTVFVVECFENSL